MIALHECSSSVVKAHGYDPSIQTLAVRFGPGKVYHYTGVPPEVATEFAGAESIGKAYGSMIRGKYDHTVVLDDNDAE